MKIYQYPIILQKKRGFHLITQHILDAVKDLNEIKTGMMQVFIQHTSASLTINENADPSVRVDFETFFSSHVPENMPHLTHVYEGADDMPAHLKTSILGTEVNIPVRNGKLCLGTWQGVYLCEHRNNGGNRHLIITLWGI